MSTTFLLNKKLRYICWLFDKFLMKEMIEFVLFIIIDRFRFSYYRIVQWCAMRFSMEDLTVSVLCD